MKNKTKKNTINRLFRKYSRNDQYLSRREIVRLMKKEFQLSYSNHIITSLMNIWGQKKGNSYIITKSMFPRLFQKPDGFFRYIIL